MPGIFGVIDTARPRLDLDDDARLAIVDRMAAAMHYDPSYSLEIACLSGFGTAIGRVGRPYHQRAAGPTRDEESLTVVTTGEPTLDRSVHGGEVSGQWIGSGSRELGGLYRRYDIQGLALVGGSFAGFIADQHDGLRVLFTDRYGMERIFVYTEDSRTYFSSEAKAILAVIPAARDLDGRGLAEFLACGGTLGDHSLFRNIKVLEAGTALVFQQHTSPAHRPYFNRATLEQLDPASERDFAAGFSESLLASVNYCIGNPPEVGVSLTGGLDSRMIMACLDAPPGAVPCYTFGSMYRETFDVLVGRAVARIAGQPHQVLKLDDRFLSHISDVFERSVYTSDGYIGLSGAAELYLNQQAKSLAPARMTGNWGGELLRGVRAFKYVLPKGDFLRPELAGHMKESAEVFAKAGRSTTNSLSYTLFHQLPVQGYGRFAVERSQVRMYAPFLANQVVEWLYRAPASARQSTGCSEAIVNRRPELLSVPTDLGLLGTSPPPTALLRRLSRKVSFKAEYLISHGAPNWMAALTASTPGERFERQFLGRHKFQHFRRWIRRELAGFVRETLFASDARDLQAWFDMTRVKGMVDEHIAGRGNYTEEIDKLLTVAILNRTLLKMPHIGSRKVAGRPAVGAGH